MSRSILHLARRATLRDSPLRHLASKIRHSSTAGATDASARASQSRAERVTSRLPKFLQPWTRPILNAPVTHVTAFLVLHELTAVVPLVSLAAAFHYTNWLPPYFSQGTWVTAGVERFGRYFRKKGWLSEQDVRWAEKRRHDKAWVASEGGMRAVVEIATAWALVKVLLPLRLAVSVSGTPWFARRVIVPFGGFLKGLFGKGGAKGKAAAGTGGVAAGAATGAATGAAGGTGATAAGVFETGAAAGGQMVRNEGPLYRGSGGKAKEAQTTAPSEARTPASPKATPPASSKSQATPVSPSSPTASSQSASPPAQSSSGVKNEGPLYRNMTTTANNSA